jgi:RND family efflux transporter MFP subunit
MKPFKRKPVVLLCIVAIAISGLGFVLFSSKPKASGPDMAPAIKPALTVTTTQPARIDLPIKLSANGNITAWQEAIIGSESSGLRLTSVRVNIGDNVHEGQILAKFSSETIKADIAQARANLIEAKANAADASGNATRARTLQATGALSTQQINQYLTSEQTAQAKVEAAHAVLTAQEVRLTQTKLVAPDDGIISARTATVGAVTSAGTELFRMIRQGRLEWRAEVTASELGRLKTDTSVTVTAANDTILKGRVRMIAPTVDLQNRTALVYVDLQPSPDNTAPAKAGMFAKGEFDLGTSSALTVPQQSVVVRDGFSYVFRLKPDNRVTQVKVQTGRRLKDRIEVTDGLSSDTIVVVSGAGFLNDSDLVKIVASGATPPDKSGQVPVPATTAHAVVQ